MPLAAHSPTTVAEFLALPDDGVDRELIGGEVVEKGITVRNRSHSSCLSRVAGLFVHWAKATGNQWDVLSGEAGFILRRDPDTIVGIDVAVPSTEVMEQQPEETALVDGVPVLAIEILSASDTQQQIHEKVSLYMESGVSLVWIIDPNDRTVRVYRPGQPPQLFNVQHEITADPELPGFTLNPSVVIDALSPSTEAYDRGKKLEHYRTIPSIQANVPIAQDHRRVEHFVRRDDGRWLLTAVAEGEVEFASLGWSIAVDEIYYQVEFPEQSVEA